MEYPFQSIECKWRKKWEAARVYQVDHQSNKPKYYVLDMFPYPSGSGLHVGHPLGYVASDIVARYKRLKGFNVLHPMGFDAFGLPAEQYAIQTGRHPRDTTEENIQRFKDQLANIGFSFDWNREIRTSDPTYFKWTQWIFMQLYQSWYDENAQKARDISELEELLSQKGNVDLQAACEENTPDLTAEEWHGMDEAQRSLFLQHYRLAYLGESTVNWCPALGTVLANDEVKEGFSERGGHPVEQKTMQQWNLRITAYAQRLLEGLEEVDFSESLKEMQKNWIGRSKGAEIDFKSQDGEYTLKAFTTRIDTIYGATFMVMAPEHEWALGLATEEQRPKVEGYIEETKRRTELERISDTKSVSGVFTGSYAINPFTEESIPIYLSDYVLAGYGTGIVMAVPAHDERDHRFAKKFDLEIRQVIEGPDVQEEAFDSKDAKVINSGMLTGLQVSEAQKKAIAWMEDKVIGQAKIQYKMRDASFSRQRYWGEPFPVYYKDGAPFLLKASELPLELPEMEDFKPTDEGLAPLARSENWTNQEDYPLDYNTMPGYAGSSWYFYRYMDPSNAERFVGKEAEDYWQDVDLYVGGTEHATGHLLYSRFWAKFLYDKGYVNKDEPYRKLLNQGMIQGRSSLVYRVKGSNTFVSKGLRKEYDTSPMHIAIRLVDENDVLDLEGFRNWRDDLKDAEFVLEDGKYLCGHQVEKMSKRLFNTVDPNDMVEQYGADTFRMYEMFLGPIEDSKPWLTKGIEGVIKFIRKFWRLVHDEQGQFQLSEEAPSEEESKIVHECIKKVSEDIERYSFNTCISAMMVCVNELSARNSNKRALIEPMAVLFSPFAPHLAEELWELLGKEGFAVDAQWPDWDEELLKEDHFEYPVSVNGKVRTKAEFPVDMPKEEIEQEVTSLEDLQKWIEGKPIKRIIVVPKRIINIVV